MSAKGYKKWILPGPGRIDAIKQRELFRKRQKARVTKGGVENLIKEMDWWDRRSKRTNEFDDGEIL